jgi:MFS family permease
MVQMPKAAVSITPGQEGHYFRELGEALHFFKGNSVLVVLIIGGILFNLGTGASDAFYLVFVVQNLHTPASLVGLFGATYGAAVITGSIVIAMFARSIGEDKLLGFSLAVWGVAMLLFARMTSYSPGLFLFFVMGFANAGINVTVGPLELRVTPRELIGRVQAVFMPILLASSMLSAALAGYLASTVLSGFRAEIGGMMFSSLDTIFTGTGLLAIIAGGYTWFALRRSMLVPTVSSQKARIMYLR